MDYGAAFVAAALAGGVQYLLWPYLKETPFLFFFGAVLYAGWLGGWGPALVCMGLSALCAHIVFLPPRFAFGTDLPALFSTLGFLIVSSFNTFLNVQLRRRSRALRSSEDRYRTLAESMPQVVWTATPDGGVDYVNEVLTTYTGRAAADLVADGWAQSLHPDDRQVAQERWSRALQTGSYYEAEHRMRRHDGQYRWFLARAHPMRDRKGQVVRWFGSSVDIEEIKHSTEALRDSEERFRVTFEQAGVGMALVGLDGRWLRVNAAFSDMLGYSADELAALTFQDITYPPDLDADLELLRRLLADEIHTYALEKRYVRKNGTTLWAHLTVALVRDRAGAPRYYISVIKDISQRKQAELALRQLTGQLEERVRDRTAALTAVVKELETFSYSISHDLRAPLRGIDGFSRALQEEHGERLDETGRDYLQRIRAATSRMGQLIDDLLNLSRITRSELRRGPVDVSALVGGSVDQLHARHAERVVQVVVQPGMQADADARLLRVVFENLLENAWKFSRDTADARVEVGTTDQEGQQVFFVSDNGAGFDPAYAAKLFLPFQRLHKQSEFEGSGIGLATVQRVISRHGGRIWAESSPGRGATFYFTLASNPPPAG